MCHNLQKYYDQPSQEGRIYFVIISLVSSTEPKSFYPVFCTSDNMNICISAQK